MTEQQIPTPHERLVAIDAELASMGATSEFCDTYYTKQAGICQDVRLGKCYKHIHSPPPLPPGLMCEAQYCSMAKDLEAQIQRLENQRAEHKASLEAIGHEETAHSFLVGCEEQSYNIKKRKRDLQTQVLHDFGEQMKLKQERYHLALRVKPVKAADFHVKCQALLEEKMRLMLLLKLGLPVPVRMDCAKATEPPGPG